MQKFAEPIKRRVQQKDSNLALRR